MKGWEIRSRNTTQTHTAVGLDGLDFDKTQLRQFRLACSHASK